MSVVLSKIPTLCSFLGDHGVSIRALFYDSSASLTSSMYSDREMPYPYLSFEIHQQVVGSLASLASATDVQTATVCLAIHPQNPKMRMVRDQFRTVTNFINKDNVIQIIRSLSDHSQDTRSWGVNHRI